MPHLSLIYGDLTDEGRAEAAAAIAASAEAIQVTAFEVYATPMSQPQDWRSVATCNLS